MLEDIASIVSWVASEESGFATGADFSVNGGLHMVTPHAGHACATARAGHDAATSCSSAATRRNVAGVPSAIATTRAVSKALKFARIDFW